MLVDKSGTEAFGDLLFGVFVVIPLIIGTSESPINTLLSGVSKFFSVLPSLNLTPLFELGKKAFANLPKIATSFNNLFASNGILAGLFALIAEVVVGIFRPILSLLGLFREGQPREWSKAQEKAVDEELSSLCAELLLEARFSVLTEAICEELLAEIQKIMGTKAKAKIDFFDDTTQEAPKGAYNRKNNQIRINSANFSNVTETKKTIVHECRHAYQWETYQGLYNHVVSAETTNEWKNSFDTYITTEDGYSFAEYAAQTIEYDAYSFARQYFEASMGGKYNPSLYAGSWGNPYPYI